MKKTAQLLTTAVFRAVAFAQTTPPAIGTFTHEGTLAFNQIGITGDTNIPANLVSSITGGALEVRQQVQLMGGDRLRVRHILVPPSAPNPTPAGSQTAVVEDYTVRIENTLRSSDPSTVTWIGTIDQLNANSPFAVRTGRPFIYSISWQGTGTSRTLSSAALLIPGRLATFMPTSRGTLTLAGESSGGTTDPGDGAPVVNIAGSPRITTSQTEIVLDATGSTDPASTALTYSWRVVRGAANIINGNTARPRIQFGNADEYVFEVTVTNAAGTSSKGTVTVFYTGRF